jgi:hypothetical protein
MFISEYRSQVQGLSEGDGGCLMSREAPLCKKVAGGGCNSGACVQGIVLKGCKLMMWVLAH